MEKRNLENEVVKKIFRNFFVPTVVSSVALSVISLTDMIIAGRMLGESALASISIVYPVTLLVMICFAVFGMGTSIQVAKLLGMGERARCNEQITAAIVLSVAVSLAVTVVGIFQADNILYLCGATSSGLLNHAKEYLMPILAGFVFMVLSPVLISILRNDSSPAIAMRIVLLCGALNLALDIVFTAVCHWGLAGIAAATVTAEAATVMAAAFWLFVRGKNFKLVKFRIHLPDLAGMAKAGLPVAMIFALQAVLTAFINHVLMECGQEGGVAIYAVLKYLIGFIYALYDGVTNSMQPMLGIYYGEREWKNIMYTAKNAVVYILVIAVLLLAGMELFAAPLALLFGISRGLLDSAVHAVRIQALFCVSAALIAWINAFDRSVGREKDSMLITVFNNCVFPIASIFCLERLMDHSIYCVFWGLLAADGLTLLLCGLLSVVRSRRGNGLRTYLQQEQEEKKDILYEEICLLEKEEAGQAEEKVEQILRDVGNACEENMFSPKTAYYIVLCVEELLVNSVQLGQDKRDVYIGIRLKKGPDGTVLLRIRDDLTAFDPTGVQAENVEDAAKESGFNLMGLKIVKDIAKEYEYKRTIGLNDFRVVLEDKSMLKTKD